MSVIISSGSAPVDIGGNAETATKLKTPVTINGVSFDGSSNITIETGGEGGVGSSSNVWEDSRYAISVALMRPSKLKWKLGPFGTFTPTERIYARIYTMVRLGPDVSNYAGAILGHSDPFKFRPFAAGDTITAHEHAPGQSFAAVSYVTETDVAAVVNGKKTFDRMMEFLTRQGTPRPFQARASGPSSGGSYRAASSPTAIPPGAYGSMVMEIIGQGYEIDLIGTVGGIGYIVPTLASKNANLSSNSWGYSWMGNVSLVLPISSSMDGNSFSWSLKVYAADTTYDGDANLYVIDLPSWWDTDAP